MLHSPLAIYLTVADGGHFKTLGWKIVLSSSIIIAVTISIVKGSKEA